MIYSNTIMKNFHNIVLEGKTLENGLNLKFALILMSISATPLSNANEFTHAGAEIEEYQYISNNTGLSKTESAITNIIYSYGKKLDSKKIEYIKARSYNHHDSDWSSVEDYRIYEKYDEGLNAYTITSMSTDSLGVLTLSKYNQDVPLSHKLLKKGTVQISAYFLHCEKEKLKNSKLKNRYFYYTEYQTGNLTRVEVNEDADYIRNGLDLICKHTYSDKTNGPTEVI